MTTYTTLTALDRWTTDTCAGIVQKVYAPSNFATGAYIPTNPEGGSLPIDIDQVDVISAIATGETAPQDLDAEDIPEMVITVGKDTYRTWYLPTALSYSHRQLQAVINAAGRGSPIGSQMLTTEPARLGMENITRVANRLAAYGTPTASGLLTDPAVPLNNTSTAINASTPVADVVRFIADEYHAVLTSNNVEDDYGYCPNALILPGRLRGILSTSNSFGITGFELLQKAIDSKRIMFSNMLSSAVLEKYGAQVAATNKDWMLVYPLADWAVFRRTSVVDPIPASYHKGKYWNGYGQVVSQTIWKHPEYARITKFTF